MVASFLQSPNALGSEVQEKNVSDSRFDEPSEGGFRYGTRRLGRPNRVQAPETSTGAEALPPGRDGRLEQLSAVRKKGVQQQVQLLAVAWPG